MTSEQFTDEQEQAKRREQVGGPMNNPQNMAASMSPVCPGAPQGPGNIQNNPGNAMRVNQPQLSSMQGFNAFPYGDVEGTGIPQKDGRMGGVFAGPNSGQPENAVPGRGLNGMAPYGFQPQPPLKQKKPLRACTLYGRCQGPRSDGQ